MSATPRLTNLAAIGQFELLRILYQEIAIAQGVWDELNAKGKQWPGRNEVAAAGWIHRHDVQNQILAAALRRDLDRGEAESITLALERQADLLLLDDREARHMAQRLGLKVIGVIGVLLEAKAVGAIVEIRSLLDALRQVAGFYVKESLYQTVLIRANEHPPEEKILLVRPNPGRDNATDT